MSNIKVLSNKVRQSANKLVNKEITRVQYSRELIDEFKKMSEKILKQGK